MAEKDTNLHFPELEKIAEEKDLTVTELIKRARVVTKLAPIIEQPTIADFPDEFLIRSGYTPEQVEEIRREEQ